MMVDSFDALIYKTNLCFYENFMLQIELINFTELRIKLCIITYERKTIFTHEGFIHQLLTQLTPCKVLP